MKRVFVCEYLSGGGADDDPAAEPGLLRAGTSMRDAIVADLLGLPDCAVSAATSVCASDLPVQAVAVRARAGETPQAFVAREARHHDLVWLVAPETDGLLAHLRRSVDGARWLGCDADAIALTTSKRATLRHLGAHGVTTPRDFDRDADVTRWVVKPDDGAGAIATRLFADHDAARAEQLRRTRAGEPVTLEPWIDGEALSASLLCRASGCELLSVNRQGIGLRADGEVSFDGVEVDVLAPSDSRRVAIDRIAGQVARAIPGLRGFVGIDLVWHPAHGPVVIEVNPRVTCAYVGLSAALGRNLAAELLAAHAVDTAHALA